MAQKQGSSQVSEGDSNITHWLALASVIVIVWVSSALIVIGAMRVLNLNPIPGFDVAAAPVAVAGILWYLVSRYHR